MSKRKHGDDDGPRPITITMGDEAPEPNGTLYGLLRDGEKIKPGDPRGTLIDRLGAEMQAFQAEQVRVAKHRRAAVKGSVTITFSVVTGPDGSQQYACEMKAKTAKIPPGMSMVFVDEDGELTGRPVEPLTEEMYRRARETPKTEPMAGPVSKV
jgi:hypothetical protein